MTLYADSLLNWGWAGICLIAFVWFAISARSGRQRSTDPRKVIALVLALVSLFPCISASDDAARLQSWNFELDHTSADYWTGGVHHNDGDSERLMALVRLLEVLEASQAAVCQLFCLLLAAFGLVAALRLRQQECLLPWRAGRSPPATYPAL
jgi:hypothetical protein